MEEIKEIKKKDPIRKVRIDKQSLQNAKIKIADEILD